MKMNLPNKLTILRVFMVPLIMLAILLPIDETVSRIAAAVIFILTSLTDMLDGKIARKYNLITDFGKFMDPLADKVMVICTLLAATVKYDYLADVLVWVTAVVVVRELAVSAIRLVANNAAGVVVAASWLGKCKTVSQIVAIVVIFIEPLILPFDFILTYHPLSYFTLAVMTVMTIWSGADYMKSYWKFLDPQK